VGSGDDATGKGWVALREGDAGQERMGYDRRECDGSGMGGCPYCGNGQATGIVATEDVMHMLEGMGIERLSGNNVYERQQLMLHPGQD